MEAWSAGEMTEDLVVLLIRETRNLSSDPVLNLACNLKASYGSCLHGMTDADWLDSSKEIKAILEVN